MHTVIVSQAVSQPGSLRAALLRALRSVAQVIARQRAERRAVAQLNAMSDRQLADIGLHRGQIHAAVRGYRGFGE